MSGDAPPTDPLADPVEIGVVARAHGIRGELRVRLHNPSSDALAHTDTLWVGGESFALDSFRPVNDAVLIRLAGLTDRTAAERFKGKTVGVPRAALGLADGEVLLADLVGLRAVLASGDAWGEVVRIETGAQDRLVVRDGDIERQLPIVDAFVGAVDLEAGTVEVDPPDDLPEG